MKDMQKQRFVAIARQIWQSLTDDEQEDYYYTEGTIGFLEDVAQILHMNICDADATEAEETAIIEELLAAVFE